MDKSYEQEEGHIDPKLYERWIEDAKCLFKFDVLPFHRFALEMVLMHGEEILPHLKGLYNYDIRDMLRQYDYKSVSMMTRINEVDAFDLNSLRGDKLEIAALKKEISDLRERAYDNARDFANFDEEIIGKICRRAIKLMNETLEFIFSGGDFPNNFTFYDCLTVLYQSRTFDEMGYGSMLEDHIEDVLYDEIDNLSPMERIILLSSELDEDLDTDIEAIHVKIFNHFKELLDKHAYTQKIMNFMEHNNYL